MRMSIRLLALGATGLAAGALPATSTFAQEGAGAPAGQERANAPTAEDELAPVRALHAALRARLGEEVDRLDLDLIMEGPDFTGTAPAFPRWSPDGRRVWFQWKRWSEDESGTWEYRLEDGTLRRLDDDEAERVPSPQAIRDRTGERTAWVVRDRVLLLERGGEAPRLVVEGIDGARPVAFTAGHLVVRSGSNLLAVRLDGGAGAALVRLTDVRSGRAPDDDLDGSRDWLRRQQLALFDTLERREARRLRARERAEALQPEPLYLEGWELSGLVPSPDMRHVVVLQRRDTPDNRIAGVPDYVTVDGYTREIRTRAKVGDAQDARRVGIIEVASGAVAWADLGLDDRLVTISGTTWSDDSRHALVEVRSIDNKDRWFAVLTPATVEMAGEAAEEATGEDEEEGAGGGAQEDAGEDEEEGAGEGAASLRADVVLAAHDHDEAWINRFFPTAHGWLPDSDRFFFVSERTGWMHLYTAAASGGDATALTAGAYEVFAPRLTPGRDAFVFEASIVDPFEVHAYTLPLEGGDATRVSAGHGREDVTLSPDGSRYVAVASSANRPPELYVAAVGSAATVALTDSSSPAFHSYDWVAPEIVHFTARDGVEVPARIYLPDDDGGPRPAVIFVHGAGYLHNVHRWWSTYSREYTFHHLLRERGYVVLDIDYRGSAGYGRDWRTAIYRHMGGQDLDDQVDGARYLTRAHGVDPERIGMYGGSYGGFITLMALFTAPETFAAGAALRPVTDWAHYNHPYTSDILNSPHEDSESYWRSSPIYFAEGLEDPLLIAHGVVDRNVHFQGVVRLAQRLIELRKENWEVALYPVEPHGFVEPASWADEYRRILKLFEDHLR